MAPTTILFAALKGAQAEKVAHELSNGIQIYTDHGVNHISDFGTMGHEVQIA